MVPMIDTVRLPRALASCMSDGLLRMMDANLNRAREAIRVMEDCARFTFNDMGLARELKDARHAVRQLATGRTDALQLAAARDTPGDVGTSITTASESGRDGDREVALAAGKRAGEALRVIEESLKVIGPETSGRAKALRYRVYDLEKRLVLAMGTGRARQWSLCVLVTEALCTHLSWDRVVQAALAGGAECIQLREKNLDGRELLLRAEYLVRMCRQAGATSIINDRTDIALMAGADGVHVGQGDVPVAAIRQLAGTRLIIGVSTANIVQATAAARDGADYCGCGPMFQTTTKHKPILAGPDYLKAYLSNPQTARVPHLAIAGIDASRAAELAAVGCRGVAVSSAVCSHPDPQASTEALVKAVRPV